MAAHEDPFIVLFTRWRVAQEELARVQARYASMPSRDPQRQHLRRLVVRQYRAVAALHYAALLANEREQRARLRVL